MPPSTSPHPSATQSASQKWGWPEVAVLGFTVAYLIPFAAICVQGGNREFLLYLAVMVILIPTVAWLHGRIGLHIGTLWGLSLWGLAHLAGGLLSIPANWPHDDSPVLYDLWIVPGRLRYDQIVHALGFGLTTWLCWQGLQAAFRSAATPIRPTLGLLTLCALGGMGLGALNEMIEFLAVLTIPATNVGGYYNTGWDLIFNAAGCCLAAVAIFLWSPRRA
jgi:hypothetical protein